MTRLTLQAIAKDIETLKGLVDDDERAHSFEDGLHEEVLKAIAEGRCEDPAKAAALALTTRNIEFCRWYA